MLRRGLQEDKVCQIQKKQTCSTFANHHHQANQVGEPAEAAESCVSYVIHRQQRDLGNRTMYDSSLTFKLHALQASPPILQVFVRLCYDSFDAKTR